MRPVPRLPLALLVLACLAVPSAALPQQVTDYRVVPLEGLVPGTFRAAAMNEAGEVAGVVFAGVPQDQVFVWRAGSLRTRAFPSAVSVEGLNEDGVVVGSVSMPSACTVFLWDSRSDELRILSTPVPAYPSDLNEDLLVVGGDCDGLQGFALDGVSGAFQGIAFGAPPAQSVGTLGTAAVNGAGLAVGSEVVFDAGAGSYVETPYVWTAGGGPVALPTLPTGFGGRAVDVSEAGTIAGYAIDDVSGKQSALWTNAGTSLEVLGSPSGYFVSEATAVNDRGEVVVVAPNDFFGFTRAFVWSRGRFTDLSAFTAHLGLFAIRPVDLDGHGTVLVELSDAAGLVVRDVVLLRPTRHARRQHAARPPLGTAGG